MKQARPTAKAPLPRTLRWRRLLPRHPLNEALGREVKHQRERRGWSLDDLHDITLFSKSHLCDLEHGLHKVSLDLILALEDGFGMAEGGIMELARRRRWRERMERQRRRSI